MILIVYASKHGATKYCAQVVAKKLGGEYDLVDCEHERVPEPESYSEILIGFSVHAGSVQKKIRKFVKRHAALLVEKQPGLFCSCLSDDNHAIEYFHKSFPASVIQSSRAIGMFGGSVQFEKMNFIERFIMKKITKTDTSFSRISDEAMDTFVQRYKKAR
ncbi:MAG: flavodoxin domain-containing protein [Spirochaetota bacterium]